MILYHAVSSYQILEVIIHSHICHRNEKCILLLPDFVKEKLNYPEGLELFFYKVYFFPYLDIPHNFETAARDTMDKYNEIVGIPLNKFSEIYVAAAHFYFSLALIYSNVSFTMFEDAAGSLDRTDRIFESLYKSFPVHACIAKSYGLIDGSNPFIKEVIVAEKYENRPVKQKKFNIMSSLSRLNKNMLRKIYKIFSGDKADFGSGYDVLLLTDNMYGSGLMTEQQQAEFYRDICLTRFDGKKILLKPHPDDKIDYSGISAGITVLDRRIPVELIPVCFSNAPKTIAAIDSSALRNLGSDAYNIISLK